MLELLAEYFEYLRIQKDVNKEQHHKSKEIQSKFKHFCLDNTLITDVKTRKIKIKDKKIK